jgi:hypothetical protein
VVEQHAAEEAGESRPGNAGEGSGNAGDGIGNAGEGIGNAGEG